MSWGFSLALTPLGGGGGGPTYTLAADAGSFTLSGQDAGQRRALRLDAAAGAFALSGQTAGLLRAPELVADHGGFVLSGQAAGLLRALRLDVGHGAFVLGGQDADVALGNQLVGGEGVFALTGQTAAFLRALRLTAAAGGIVLSGQAATITPSGAEEPEDAAPLELGEAGEIAILGPNVSFRISGVAVLAPTTPLAVQRAVLRALTIALAGRDVPVFDHVPHGQGFPFVELGTMQVLTVDATEAEGYEIIFYLTVWSAYRGQAEVLEILQLIYNALHDQNLALEHGPLVLSRLTEQRTDRDADGVTYMGNATARIMAMV